MAGLKISCSHIKHKIQLNEENLNLIFKSHFNDQNIEIEIMEDSDQTDIGEHYASDISKLTVKLKNGEFPIQMIIKEPIQSFLQKIASKLMKPFMRETFWYMEAIPALKNIYPEIETISAKCFHAITAYQDDYR